MPIGFWSDPDRQIYQRTYFERYPGVWHHGDFVELTSSGGMILNGRSDATLNPGGIRIGTAEIYRQVEQLPFIEESLVIGQEWKGDVRVVLFVKLAHEKILTEENIAQIKTQIRNNTTVHHVPKKILQVKDIPRTRSGKIVELAVREIVHHRAINNLEAIANPESLEEFRGRGELGEE